MVVQGCRKILAGEFAAVDAGDSLHQRGVFHVAGDNQRDCAVRCNAASVLAVS